MQKLGKARSRSQRKDPAQEEIVSQKDFLNERTTKLIEFLKELKKGWNGGPAPAVGISEKINLTDPLPNELSTGGAAAVRELSEITRGLDSVVSLQSNYSKERTERLENRLKQMSQAGFLDLSMQKTASNKLTRLWSHIVAPFSSENGKRDRLKMLRHFASIDSELKDIEEEILKGNILEGLQEARQIYYAYKPDLFDRFSNDLDEMVRTSKMEVKRLEEEFKELTEKDKVIPGTTNPPPKPSEQRDKIINQETFSGNDEQEPTTTTENDYSGFEDVVDEENRENTESIVQDITDAFNDLNKAVIRIPNIPPPEDESTQENDQEIESKNIESIPIDLVNKKKTNVEQEPESEDEDILTEPSSESVAYENISESDVDPSSSYDVPEDYFDEEDIPPSSDEEEPQIEEVDPNTWVTYIFTDIKSLFKDVEEAISKFDFIPEPWNSSISEKWNSLVSDISNVKQNYNDSSKAGIIRSYLEFIRNIGRISSDIQSLEAEIEASKKRNDFEFGTTYNKSITEKNAETYFQSKYTALLKVVQPNITKQASAISRKYHKMMTYLSSDKNKHIRLFLSKKIGETRKAIQRVMNSLEKRNIDFKRLIMGSSDFYESLSEVFLKLVDLANFYNSKLRVEKSELKQKGEKFKYEFIPVTEINSTRRIGESLQRDISNIKMVSIYEDKMDDLYSKIDNLKKNLGVDQ